MIGADDNRDRPRRHERRNVRDGSGRRYDTQDYGRQGLLGQRLAERTVVVVFARSIGRILAWRGAMMVVVTVALLMVVRVRITQHHMAMRVIVALELMRSVSDRPGDQSRCRQIHR